MTGFPAYSGLVDLTAELPADLITKQVFFSTIRPIMGQFKKSFSLNLLFSLFNSLDNEFDQNACMQFCMLQVDYLSSSHPFVAVHFILECGAKLEAESITISTAARWVGPPPLKISPRLNAFPSLFHKFCSATSLSDYDPYLLAATCLYLAGKVGFDYLQFFFSFVLPSLLSWHCSDRGQPPQA